MGAIVVATAMFLDDDDFVLAVVVIFALAHSRTFFRLADQAEKHPDRMSGGQQQRAALVRALCTRPTLLLLDEITAALDPELVGDVLRIVRDLAEQGTTMILATHEMAFAREVASTVCFLDQGRVCEQGTPEQIFSDPAQERTRRFLARVLP